MFTSPIMYLDTVGVRELVDERESGDERESVMDISIYYNYNVVNGIIIFLYIFYSLEFLYPFVIQMSENKISEPDEKHIVENCTKTYSGKPSTKEIGGFRKRYKIPIKCT